MKLRTRSIALAAAAGLALGNAAFAQQGQPQRGQAPQDPQQQNEGRQQSDRGSGDRPGQQGKAGQQGQGGQQGDAQQQIEQALAQIAADPKTAADKLFVLTAAIHTQSEIALAKEVLEKSQNEQVKKMAKQMIDSLKKTQDQLQQTAQAIGLPLPQELAQAALQEVHIVAALPADQLDRQYMAHAQADNAQDLSDYQSQAEIAQDPQVRRMAKDQATEAQQRSQGTNQTARGMGMQGGSGDAQPAGAKIQGDGR